MWFGENRTSFRGTSRKPENIGSCHATGVLKMDSVYCGWRSKCHLEVFLKECNYRKGDMGDGESDDEWGFEKRPITTYKFCQIQISSEEFNSVHETQDVVDLRKIRVSDVIAASEFEIRYAIGYEIVSGEVIPFRTRGNGCRSLKEMGFFERMFSGLKEYDGELADQYNAIWRRAGELVLRKSIREPRGDRTRVIFWGDENRIWSRK